MLNPLENYFLKQPEPHQGCMLYLRKWLINQDFEEHYKYMTAMYYFKGKPFCYMSVRTKDSQLYLGFWKGHEMKHPQLKKEGRKLISAFYIDPEKDLPVKTLSEIVTKAKKLY